MVPLYSGIGRLLLKCYTGFQNPLFIKYMDKLEIWGQVQELLAHTYNEIHTYAAHSLFFFFFFAHSF